MAKKKPKAKKPVDKRIQAEKRARREERKLVEAEAKQRAVRKGRIRLGSFILVGVVAVGAIGFLIIDRATLSELPGVSTPAYEGRAHVAPGQAVHGTATPTSGQHYAAAPRCGVYTQQLPLGLAVHALEHGVVVIWYQPLLAAEEVSGLLAIVNGFDDRVILSPNNEMIEPVVATAWNRLKAYDGADSEIEQFIETYRNRGLEDVRCPY